MSHLNFSLPATWDRLWETLYGADGESIAYVYRIDRQGKTLCPFLVRCPASPDLPLMLRDEYGGGLFRVLIRRGRAMQFSGTVAVVEGYSSQ